MVNFTLCLFYHNYKQQANEQWTQGSCKRICSHCQLKRELIQDKEKHPSYQYRLNRENFNCNPNPQKLGDIKEHNAIKSKTSTWKPNISLPKLKTLPWAQQLNGDS